MKSYWLAAPVFLYAAYAAARSDLRVEHVLVALAVTGLAVLGPRSRELLGGLYPFALVGLLFDAMRAFQNVGVSESRVLLCDLRSLESRLFGWESSGQRMTLHDFFRDHHTPALDVLCAIPYATFIAWCVAGAVFLYVKDRPAMQRFAWGFLLLNVAGFVTYHLLPAAPPWYFHAHGCVVDLTTKASEGAALARVDALLGFAYFHGMYGKASSVFGALPSLHCAYPLLLVLEGWRAFGPRLRAVAIAYWVAMVFSAIYLDHHWVLDALLGSAYAVAVSGAMRLFGAARASRAFAHRARVVKRRAAFVVATWFGSGLSPVAPGTVGTLAALPVYFAVRELGPSAVLAAALVFMAVGVWAAGIVAKTTGQKDPQIVVIDEVAGVLVALAAAPRSILGLVAAVVLFRVFDMTKPFPARAAESLPGGLGIVIDDVVAGAWVAVLVVGARAAGLLA